MANYGEAGTNIQEQSATSDPMQIQMPSLRDNLSNQLKRAQAEVSRLEELITLLDQNPEVNRIMELLGRKY
jgi:hypothetical protein